MKDRNLWDYDDVISNHILGYLNLDTIKKIVFVSKFFSSMVRDSILTVHVDDACHADQAEEYIRRFSETIGSLQISKVSLSIRNCLLPRLRSLSIYQSDVPINCSAVGLRSLSLSSYSGNLDTSDSIINNMESIEAIYISDSSLSAALLTKLTKDRNSLHSLSVFNESALQSLNLRIPKLQTLTINKCPIVYVGFEPCFPSKLCHCDLSWTNIGVDYVEYLVLQATRMRSLVLCHCMYLVGALNIFSNSLQTLNLTGCLALQSLQIIGREIESIRLEQCEELVFFHGDSLKLEKMDFSNRSKLEYCDLPSSVQDICFNNCLSLGCFSSMLSALTNYHLICRAAYRRLEEFNDMENNVIERSLWIEKLARLFINSNVIHDNHDLACRLIGCPIQEEINLLCKFVI